MPFYLGSFFGNVARPDTKSISVAMDACAKSGLTSEAERLLNGIDDSKKNCLLFNTVMSGYKSEGRGNAAEAALRRMISLSEKGWEHCSPDAISYTLCMEAVSFMINVIKYISHFPCHNSLIFSLCILLYHCLFPQ